MFNNSKGKKVLIITLALMLVLSTVVVAANNIYTKELTATYGRIKFKVDGKDVTKEIEDKYGTPAFVAGDRSYVPVRAIAELMGLEIDYDNETHVVELIDSKSESYEKKIKDKDNEITKLKQEIIKLEKEVKDLKKDVVEETDLKTLEKKLNKDYGNYMSVDFDIALKETNNNIKVTIEVDFYNTMNRNYWNRMNTSDRKYMIEGITGSIANEFPNANITGEIYDTYYRDDLLTFSKKKNSNVSISYRSGYGDDRYIYDDEIYDIVNDEFYYERIYNVDVYNVDSSYYDVYFSVDIPNNSEWRYLSNSNKLAIFDRISSEIFRYYDYEKVVIDIRVDGSYWDKYTRYWNE